MRALVLCGGRGTRLDADVEKPLYEVGGRRTIDRVLDALAAAADIDEIYAAVSPQAPRTREHLEAIGGDVEAADRAGEANGYEAEVCSDDVEIVETPGDGYVSDLDAALAVVGRPALTVAADLPLLAAAQVHEAIAASEARERSLTVGVPAALKRQLGVSCDLEREGVVPSGLNVVGPAEAEENETIRSYDARLAVNVNTVEDARIAEELLRANTTGTNGETTRRNECVTCTDVDTTRTNEDTTRPDGGDDRS